MSYSGLASPVNDVIVMDGNKQVGPGTVGEVWIRGPNVMQGYWNDEGEKHVFLVIYSIYSQGS